jgi:DNA polymerase III gamma/tau subunit
MKAINIQKTFKLTIEATEDEFRDLLSQLDQCAGYGADAELKQIVSDMVGEEDDEE